MVVPHIARHEARADIFAKAYTINAIAIPADNEDPHQPLSSYFAQSVISGSQAFVTSPKDPHDYVMALRRKLVAEVSMEHR